MDHEPRFLVQLITNNYPARGGRWDNVTMTVYNPDGWDRYMASIPPPHSDADYYTAAACMSEYFTREQAEQVRAWISERYGPNIVSVTVEQVDMDWVKESYRVAGLELNDGALLPLSHVPLDRNHKMYVFSDEDGYDLDVKAAGRFRPFYDGAVFRADGEVEMALSDG